MRAHTNLRNAFRLGLMLAATAGVGFASTDANADVSNGGPANTSTGTAVLKFDYNKKIDTSITTGEKSIETTVFNFKLRASIEALMSLDTVAPNVPLYTVDMPKGAIVQASWSGDKKIVLKTMSGAQTDGKMTVRHSLSPEIILRASVGDINLMYKYDATALLQKLQSKVGANAVFNYDSTAAAQFTPWGYTPAQVKLNSPNLDGAEILNLSFDVFPEFITKHFDGEFGVRAITKPTFQYKTTKVSLGGAPGAITAAAGEVSLGAPDADFLDTVAAVEGEVEVNGSMDVQPFVKFTQVPNLNGEPFPVNIDIPITAISGDYTGKIPTQKVTFPAVKVHIPLPNVKAPNTGLNIGNAEGGKQATRTVTIDNTGEKAAVVSFKSSDPQFQVPGGTITIEPKSKYDMQITFAAANSGPAEAEVTVMSNDADSPEQIFKVGGNGADVGDPADGPGKAGGEGDSGCGCKTAGSGSIPSWAGIGLIGLGVAAFVRRRRSA